MCIYSRPSILIRTVQRMAAPKLTPVKTSRRTSQWSPDPVADSQHYKQIQELLHWANWYSGNLSNWPTLTKTRSDVSFLEPLWEMTPNFVSLSNRELLFGNCRGQRSGTDVTELTSRCGQGCIPSGGSRDQSVPLSFPASGGCWLLALGPLPLSSKPAAWVEPFSPRLTLVSRLPLPLLGSDSAEPTGMIHDHLPILRAN